jgi:hypothetical protein
MARSASCGIGSIKSPSISHRCRSRPGAGHAPCHPHFYLHSINPATGAERTGWPVTIQGSGRIIVATGNGVSPAPGPGTRSSSPVPA